MLRIELFERRRNYDGTPVSCARAEGLEAADASGSPIHALCRLLVAAGRPDGPWEAYRDDQRSIYGTSIQWMADRTTTGSLETRPVKARGSSVQPDEGPEAIPCT